MAGFSNAEVALIFDMDGVLIDNRVYHLQAWVEFCQRYGIIITAEEFDRSMFGGSNRDLLEKVFQKKLTENEAKTLADEKEALYRKLHAADIHAMAGVKEFILKARSAGIPVALATAAPRANLDFMLDHTGMWGFFDVMTDDYQVIRGKPDPEIYLKTAAQLGVPPETCIVFEDSLTGIKSAQTAGMKVIGVTTSFSGEALKHTWKQINTFEKLSLNDLR